MTEQPPGAAGGEPLDAGKLTWAVLLGRWVAFARSALALPDDEPGRVMRGSVSDIIALQAVWFALQHLDELDADQRALGIARAEVLIDRHGEALKQRWRGRALPEELAALIRDAQDVLRRERDEG